MANETHQKAIENAEQRMLALVQESESIQARADAAGAQLTQDEANKIAANLQEFEGCKAEIGRRKGMLEAAAQLAAPASSTPIPQPFAASPAAPKAARFEYVEGPKSANGFRSFGEFVRSVINAGVGRGIDPRFHAAAATTAGTEGTSADGGYAVPPDFRETIVKKVMGETNLMSMCEQFVTSSYKVTVPLDTATPWQTSGGILTYWVGENTAITQSKPALSSIDIQAYKLAALVPLTDELISDAPALNAWLPGKVSEKITSAMNAALIAGSGDGSTQPTGIVGSAGEVVQAAVSGQGANTIVWKNVTGMYSRMLPQLIPQSVWLVHPATLPQLLEMSATAGNVPVWLPPTAATYSAGMAGPAGTLLGRPVYLSENNPALGSKGDIIFFAPKTYGVVTKAGGVQTDLSIHFFFDAVVSALRAVVRVGGKSMYTSTVSPKNGSATYGNVITLNATRT